MVKTITRGAKIKKNGWRVETARTAPIRSFLRLANGETDRRLVNNTKKLVRGEQTSLPSTRAARVPFAIRSSTLSGAPELSVSTKKMLKVGPETKRRRIREGNKRLSQ